VLALDMLTLGRWRITVVGCQDGLVQVAIADRQAEPDSRAHDCVSSWRVCTDCGCAAAQVCTTYVDGPVSSVRLFRARNYDRGARLPVGFC
jgi:hypothetical protein